MPEARPGSLRDRAFRMSGTRPPVAASRERIAAPMSAGARRSEPEEAPVWVHAARLFLLVAAVVGLVYAPSEPVVEVAAAVLAGLVLEVVTTTRRRREPTPVSDSCPPDRPAPASGAPEKLGGRTGERHSAGEGTRNGEGQEPGGDKR